LEDLAGTIADSEGSSWIWGWIAYWLVFSVGVGGGRPASLSPGLFGNGEPIESASDLRRRVMECLRYRLVLEDICRQEASSRLWLTVFLEDFIPKCHSPRRETHGFFPERVMFDRHHDLHIPVLRIKQVKTLSQH
jgi:hypothetical protein